jgi:hypothetical protein
MDKNPATMTTIAQLQQIALTGTPAQQKAALDRLQYLYVTGQYLKLPQQVAQGTGTAQAGQLLQGQAQVNQ